MSPLLVGILGIVVVLVLLFLSMPVGLSLALVGFAGFAYLKTLGAAGSIMGSQILGNIHGYSLTVIPLFILMGSVAANSKIAERLFNTAHKCLGSLPGGLAISTIGGCTGFAAICGSSFATAATMCKVAFPEMERYGYKPELSAGCIASGGTLGILIPPSTSFVLYGLITELSIGKLFMAGIVPGIIRAVLFAAVILIWASLDPAVGPAGPKVKFKEKLKSLTGSVEAVILFLVVFGGLFMGWFTPTEAGAVGAAGILVIATARRFITWPQFLTSLRETVRTSAMLIFLIVGAMIFARFIALSRLPFELANTVGGLPVPPIVIMVVILLSYIILGCIMDTLSMIVITVPIYLPIIVSLGFDPIWFGVIVVVVMEIAQVTPPMGVIVWIVSGMLPHIPMGSIFKGVLIFLIADVPLIILLVAFPQIALTVPGLMS